MATVEQHVPHTGRESRSAPTSGRHHGRDPLAEVIMIRSHRAHSSGRFGSLVTEAREFASPRNQATSVRFTPHPPSSPDPRSSTPPPAPNDAA